jgi:hypothetical protein
MAQLDRLGWTVGLSGDAWGVTIGVRSNDEAALEVVRAALPPGWRASDSPVVDNLLSLWLGRPPARRGRRSYDLLYLGSQGVARTLDREELFDALENIALLTVASQAREHLFVHAGVVARNGRAVLLPGRSGVGKTTLVRELTAAGWSCYSDEVAVLDRDGLVHPFRRALRVRTPQGTQRVPAGGPDLPAGGGPLAVERILFTRFAAAASWVPSALSPGRALMLLLENAVAPRREPELALEVLRRVALGAQSLQSARGESAQVVEFLARELPRAATADRGSRARHVKRRGGAA